MAFKRCPGRWESRALCIDAYRMSRVTGDQLRQLLDIPHATISTDSSSVTACHFEYTIDDFEREGATSADLREKREKRQAKLFIEHESATNLWPMRSQGSGGSRWRRAPGALHVRARRGYRNAIPTAGRRAPPVAYRHLTPRLVDHHEIHELRQAGIVRAARTLVFRDKQIDRAGRPWRTRQR